MFAMLLSLLNHSPGVAVGRVNTVTGAPTVFIRCNILFAAIKA
jgi:hypothetical protein